MASTEYQDYNENTPITAAWLNDVNDGVYTPTGKAKLAVQSSAVWVRFTVVGGVVTVNQSSNISSVVRLSLGVYVINYSLTMTNAANCYELSMNQAGFIFPTAETTGSVTLSFENAASALTDPGFASVVVYGAN